MKEDKEETEIKETFEELLYKLRKEKNWTYLEVASKLNNTSITDKDVEQWEKGYKYPDTDMLYELSCLYQIPFNDLVKAQNNSYTEGILSTKLIKKVCDALNISIRVGIVLMVVFYVVALSLAFAFFMSQTSMIAN